MKKSCVFYSSIVFLILFNMSLQWPVKDCRITSTFGESRGDHFHDGIDLISPQKIVFPISKATTLYCWNKYLFPLDNYPGAGNYLVLEHKNSDNIYIKGEKFYSVYFHLQDSEEIKEKYNENESLGNYANSGRSYGGHIHFGIIDILKWSSINSIQLLPDIDDKKPPLISDFAIKIEDKYTILRNESTIRLTKHYPILIKIIDTINGGERLGIYRLKVIFNDKIVADIKFDKMDFLKKQLTFSGNKFHDLYDKNGYYKIKNIKYRQGENIWLVKAEDYTGNTSEKIFKLYINLDM